MESIIAITIIVVALLGLFALLSQSIGLRRVTTERYIATYLATEGVEVVKNILDTNVIRGLAWNNDVTPGSYEVEYDDTQLQVYQDRFLRVDPATGLYQYTFGDPTIFTRRIVVNHPGGTGEEVQVNVIVEWTTRGGGEFSINLEDHFYNWQS